jgi:hypothetical protein
MPVRHGAMLESGRLVAVVLDRLAHATLRSTVLARPFVD